MVPGGCAAVEDVARSHDDADDVVGLVLVDHATHRFEIVGVCTWLKV